MNREEIMELAKQAGFWQEHTNTWMCNTDDIAAFAALVAAHEREECAKVVESAIPFGKILDTAAAIRARGTEK